MGGSQRSVESCGGGFRQKGVSRSGNPELESGDAGYGAAIIASSFLKAYVTRAIDGQYRRTTRTVLFGDDHCRRENALPFDSDSRIGQYRIRCSFNVRQEFIDRHLAGVL